MDDSLVVAVRKNSAPYRVLEGTGDLHGLAQHSIMFGRGEDIDAPISGEIVVLERPRLHEFLVELKSFANVILFTAGLESKSSPSSRIWHALVFRLPSVRLLFAKSEL
jgi:hypothetical protein